MTTIFLSAGDASGEQHAAELVGALREHLPGARFLGLGGPEMEKAGVELVVDQHELAVGGLVEVLRDAGRIVGVWRKMVAALRESKPDLVILVDSPDFNIPFARAARRQGRRQLYYISPQVWAWRPGRVRKIARRVDRMAVIFPFEREVYEGTGLRVDFVGHPLVDRITAVRETEDRASLRRRLGFDEGRPVVALLPGSRRNEIRTGLPLQVEVARRVLGERPEAQLALGVAPSIPRATIDSVLEAEGAGDLRIRLIEDATLDLVRAADVALTKPGTITVEIALLGTPMVVATRVHPLTAAIGRRVIRVPAFAMPNLIVGEIGIPEFVQEEAVPERVARALIDLLGPAGDEQRRFLERVTESLGHGGAAERAAEVALEMVRGPDPA